jgi:N-acetylglucosaminyldiphosphoundecaprenol N-acetyl-beta-D-mannosaminyltransferase
MQDAANRSLDVLGVRVDALQIPSVIDQVERWISAQNTGRYVTLTNVHSVMEAQHDAAFRQVLNNASLSVPDGMPLVWLGRLQGIRLRRRVYGPELLEEFCHATRGKGYRHFFFGGRPGVAERLVERFTKRFPGFQSAGTYSPPFRPLTKEEDAEIVALINATRPDVVWVGLGCPKQEIWMSLHCGRLSAAVTIGVGQAFDLFGGDLRQAPRWMRENGLEWLFRLTVEPRRLWRRYLVYNTQFLFNLVLDAAGWRQFRQEEG